MPNIVQTHTTLFEIVVAIPKFPRTPNIARRNFGRTCKNMMHEVLSFIKHYNFNDWREQADKEFMWYSQTEYKNIIFETLNMFNGKWKVKQRMSKDGREERAQDKVNVTRKQWKGKTPSGPHRANLCAVWHIAFLMNGSKIVSWKKPI